MVHRAALHEFGGGPQLLRQALGGMELVVIAEVAVGRPYVGVIDGLALSAYPALDVEPVGVSMQVVIGDLDHEGVVTRDPEAVTAGDRGRQEGTHCEPTQVGRAADQ